MNFYLFSIYVEKYSKWSSFRTITNKYEFIVDFGYWRIYLTQ